MPDLGVAPDATAGATGAAAPESEGEEMDYSGTTIWRDEGLRGRAGYRRPESVRVRAVGEVECEGG